MGTGWLKSIVKNRILEAGQKGEVCKNRWTDLNIYTSYYVFPQKDVPFRGVIDNADHLGGQIPKNAYRYFGRWIGIFKPNTIYY